jgi:hypothetical protein
VQKDKLLEWEEQVYCMPASGSGIERDISQHPVSACLPPAIRNSLQIYRANRCSMSGHGCETTLKLE